MADVGSFELLPAEKKKFDIVSFVKKNPFMVAGVFLLVLVGVVYMVLMIMVGNLSDEIVSIDGKLAAIHNARKKDDEQKLLNFDKQIQTLQSIVDKHVVWTTAFKTLQSLVLPEVTFKTLDADASRRILTIQASADSYTTVAKQIASFYNSPSVVNVAVSKIGVVGTGGIEFNAEITFKSDQFMRLSASPTTKPTATATPVPSSVTSPSVTASVSPSKTP